MFQVNPLLIRLDVSGESSARQRIHLKHQALFSSKIKLNIKMSSAAIFVWCFMNIVLSFSSGPVAGMIWSCCRR